MLPWAHAGVGYLAYSLGLGVLKNKRPNGTSTFVVIFGTQLPDFVDKPLAWTFGILPRGRMFMHSLLFIGLLVVIVSFITWRIDKLEIGAAFGVSILSHPLADAMFIFFGGDFSALAFLFWPLTTPAVYDGPTGFSLLIDTGSGEYFWFQTIITILASARWVSDGFPGMKKVQMFLGEQMNLRGS